LKKLTGSVRFRFFKPWTKKTEPNQTEPEPKKTGKKQSKTEPNRKNWARPEKIEPNRFEPVFVLKNRTELKPVGLNRFRFGFGFFKKKFSLVIFYKKNRIEPKIKTPRRKSWLWCVWIFLDSSELISIRYIKRWVSSSN